MNQRTNTIELSFTLVTTQELPTIQVSINLSVEVEESFEQVSKNERKNAERMIEKN
jgi:hypothetical protein